MYERLPAHRSQRRGSGLLRTLNAHSAPVWPPIGSQDKPIASAKNTRGSQTIRKSPILPTRLARHNPKPTKQGSNACTAVRSQQRIEQASKNASVRSLRVLALRRIRQDHQPAQLSTSTTCARLLHGSATPLLRSDNSQTKTREGGSSSSRPPFENDAHTTTSRLSPS